MCVVSMIGDHYRDHWTDPQRDGWHIPYVPPTQPIVLPSPVSKEEFDALRKEVLEMKKLLKRAKDYDEKNNEPDCEIDEKMELLRKVAKLVGVDLDDVIKPKSA